MNSSELVLDPKRVNSIIENTAKLATLAIQHRIFQHHLYYGLSRMGMNGKLIEKESPTTRNLATSHIYIHYALGMPEVASCDVVFKMEKDSGSGTHVVVAILTPTEKGNGKGVDLFFIYLALLLAYHSGVEYVKLPMRYKKEDLIQGLEVKSSWFGGLPIQTGKGEVLLNLKGTDEDEWEFRSLKIIHSVRNNARGIWLKDDPSMELMSLAHKKAPPPQKRNSPPVSAPLVPVAPVSAPLVPVAPVSAPLVPVNEPKGFFNRLKRSVNNARGSNTAKRFMNSAKGSVNRMKGSVNELKESNTAKRFMNSAKGSVNRMKGFMNSSSTPSAPVAPVAPVAPGASVAPVAPVAAPSKGFFNSFPTFKNPFSGGTKTHKKRRGSKSSRHRRRGSSKKH